jgi:phospholipid/cholesterol/gamma-HCH transport system permease protein
MLTNEAADASAADLRRDEIPRISETGDARALAVTLGGAWTTRSVTAVDEAVDGLAAREGVARLLIDLSGVTRMDTAGAWLIDRLAAAQRAAGADVAIVNASPAAVTLLEAIGRAAEHTAVEPQPERRNTPYAILEAIGRGTYAVRDDFIKSMHILGATIRGAQMKLGRGHAVNPTAIVNHIDRMGVGAIPVIVLMSSIVGAIVAQQGAFQLRYFGAEIFVVDLVGILVWRELGVLLTAIMIAGRSGSAITAEIGSMKMREEVDALTVIGLNPIGVLVFPRLVALVVALPCLTIIANFSAIGGAMAVSWIYIDITPSAFVDRMRESIDISTVLAGLIKAPFMALIIGVIASVEGMKVGGSAESLGRQVTTSVVKAIFVVIVVDGIFAMFYASIDF